MASSIKSNLETCTEYVDNIMNDISTILNNSDIEYSVINDYEILIPNKKKKDIKGLLDDEADSLFTHYKKIVSIIEADDNTYIRQLYK